jgi:hypothetical protein
MLHFTLVRPSGRARARGALPSMVANPGALLHKTKGGPPLLIQHHNFAVEDRVLSANEFGQPAKLWIARRQIVVIARQQADFAIFDKGDGTVAVPLNFEKPVGIVERLLDDGRQHRSDGGRHWPLLRAF